MAKNLGSQVRGFVEHYGREISAVAAVLETIISQLPIDKQDKERLSDVLAGLQSVADNIAGSLSNIPDTTVTVKKSDVEAAVKSVLPGIVKKIMEEQGNGSNA